MREGVLCLDRKAFLQSVSTNSSTEPQYVMIDVQHDCCTKKKTFRLYRVMNAENKSTYVNVHKPKFSASFRFY